MFIADSGVRNSAAVQVWRMNRGQARHIVLLKQKVMLTLFWDHKCPMVEHYTEKGKTVTSATYSELMRDILKPAIRTKRRGLLSTGVLIQHDNARPHTARSTLAPIKDLRLECILFTPPTSRPPTSTSLAH